MIKNSLVFGKRRINMETMLAAVLYAPGPPSVLKVEKRPIPVPKEGEVLVRVHAFGLNRSE